MRPAAFLVLFHLSLCATAQDKRDQARDLAREAVQMMDEGRIEESIKLLEKADKLDPSTHTYVYEIGFAHQLNKDYTKAATFFRKATKAPDATDQCYQMLGNVLDMGGDPSAALEAYDEGLARFPDSGRLYMEKATLANMRKDFDEAIRLHEKGIEVEPTYATNYHRLVLLFLPSGNEVWSMLYGELFMNIERYSERTLQMGKMLYDTYKREITFPTDSTVAVSFCQSMVIDVSDLGPDGKPRLPFGSMGYEIPLSIATAGEHSIDLASLNRIRTRFLDYYYANGLDKQYPNLLFAYQRKVQEAGFLEAYNYWVVRKGDDASFRTWQQAHRDHWATFLDWLRANPIPLDKDHLFLRTQY